MKEIKQMIRDKINPDKDLGHSDVQKVDDNEETDTMDDDEAAEARRYFGVD